MSVLAWISLAGMLCAAIYASISDITRGIIPNAALAPMALIAALLDVAHYGFLSPDLLTVFLANIAIVAALSCILFAANIWAGGDCKLLCVLALLFPAELYLPLAGQPFSLFGAIALAFVLGWVFIVGQSIAEAAKGDGKYSLREFATRFGDLALCYVTVILLVGAIMGTLRLTFPEAFSHLAPFMPFASFAVALAIRRFELHTHLALPLAFAAIDIVMTMVIGTIPLTGDGSVYLVALAAMGLKTFSAQGRYQTIPTEQVEQGMILSVMSSMLMARSRVMGLPSLSTEGLESRLTSSEAESVRRWGNSKNGQKEVQIIKKIPFAPFVSAGFLAYLLLWRIV